VIVPVPDVTVATLALFTSVTIQTTSYAIRMIAFEASAVGN
jgi:hypothetical protein